MSFLRSQPDVNGFEPAGAIHNGMYTATVPGISMVNAMFFKRRRIDKPRATLSPCREGYVAWA